MNNKEPTSMLVLTRKIGQALMIGEKIEVRLLPPRITGEVRVGITAPRTVLVLRKELHGRGPREGSRDKTSREGRDHV